MGVGHQAAILAWTSRLLLLLLLVPSTTHAKWRQDELAISFFLDPPTTLQSYQLVAGANFTVMLGSTPKNASMMREQARLCKATGLKCVLGGPPSLSIDRKGCHGSMGDDSVDIASLPPPDDTTWGYYLRDEPASSLWPLVKKQQDRLHAAHPNALVFINLGPPGGGGAGSTHPPESGFDAFVSSVEPDVLSLDTYPTFGGLRDDGLATTDTRLAYLADLNVTRAAAMKGRVPWWLYFNAAQFEWCDDPTESQIAWQVFTALAYGSRGIMWFFYQNPLPPCDRPFLKLPGVVDTDGAPTEKYHQAQRINSRAKALGPTLMQLQSTAVVQLSWTQSEAAIVAQLLASPCGLTSISKNYLTVGCFVVPSAAIEESGTHRNHILPEGARAVFIVNYEHAHSTLIELAFDVPTVHVQEVNQRTGQLVPVADYALPKSGTGMNGTHVHLGPGMGRLYVLPPKPPTARASTTVM